MIAFSEDLIEAYPEAKVVLTYRDVDSWYRSYNQAVIGSMNAIIPNLACGLSTYLWRIREVHFRAVKGWLGMKIDTEDMRAKAKQAYWDHYANVKRVTPPERLLEFKLEDGWKPLCDFLRKPVPNRPFPRVNDAQALEEKITLLCRRGLVHVLRRSLMWSIPVAAGLAIAYWIRTQSG